MSGNGGTVDNLPRVAIVGFGLRVPGARTPEELWAMLRDGVEGIEHFPYERRERSLLDPDEQEDPTWVGAAGVLPDAGCFDAGFFGYTPREAEVIDPQQRLFLECAWEALERAGYDPERYAGAVGVYRRRGCEHLPASTCSATRQLSRPLGVVPGSRIGNDKDFLCRRASAYKLEPARPERHRADRVLDLAGRRPPGLPEPAQRRVRHGAGRRRLGPGRRSASGYLYLRGGILSPRRPLPRVRRRAQRHGLRQRRRRSWC